MYRNILVAIDDSDTARCALAEAVQIARASAARLYVAHVADETLMGMHNRTFTTTLNLDHALQAIVAAGQALLAEAVAGIDGIAVTPLLLEARQRRVAEVIAEQAQSLGCDLIVLGRHGRRGLARLLLGSVAEQVAKVATASVLLVRKH